MRARVEEARLCLTPNALFHFSPLQDRFAVANLGVSPQELRLPTERVLKGRFNLVRLASFD
jgi:hypothetical protein